MSPGAIYEYNVKCAHIKLNFRVNDDDISRPPVGSSSRKSRRTHRQKAQDFDLEAPVEPFITESDLEQQGMIISLPLC